MKKFGKKHILPIDMVCLWVYSNTIKTAKENKGAQE